VEQKERENVSDDIIIHRATASLNGVRFFHLDTGSAEPVMLCLHGRWGRALTWLNFMRRYADRYRIIAPDQRGHGLTDKPDWGYSPSEMADDAYNLLEHLGCNEAIVVGHSMGGKIAAFLTDRHPEMVKAVAILDVSAAESPKAAATALEPDDDGLTKDWPVPFMTYPEAVDFLKLTFERETNVRYFLDSLVETEKGFDFMFSRKAMATIESEHGGFPDLLPRLKCPVCLVRATESIFFSSDEAGQMRDRIADCTYFEVADSDHMVYEDNPEQFYTGFDAFLQKLR
jgi:pimeloyl-ACP methyl ester carboxylesterase